MDADRSIPDKLATKWITETDPHKRDVIFAQLYDRVRPILTNLFRDFSRTRLSRDWDCLKAAGDDGILNALRNYDPDRGHFVGLARICCRRSMLTAIERADQNQYSPLADAVTIHQQLEHKFGTIEDHLLADSPEPLDQVIRADQFRSVKLRFDRIRFSKFEMKVIDCRLKGLSMLESAAICNTTKKSIDNATERIRRKFRQHWEGLPPSLA